MSVPKWKQFEMAVAKFVAALDKNAVVEHDVKLPDIHSGSPRQRDVWVEAKVCKHFPINIYISCKRENKPLDQQDMDAFNGELISSGASLGVIYSYSGFTKEAIRKAKKLGISCCKLFEKEPPDIPESLFITKSFCCTPKLNLAVIAPLDPNWNIRTWEDLFRIEFIDNGKKIPAIDAISERYLGGEKQSVDHVRNGSNTFPLSWERKLTYLDDETGRSLSIMIRCIWIIYEGKMSANLLNGSYNFTNQEFIGTQITPVVDRQSIHPGPDWELLKKIPSEESLANITKGVFILSGANVKDAITKTLGTSEITIIKID
jgi:hypothetical protein